LTYAKIVRKKVVKELREVHMINWILGGLIIVVTLYIIIRTVNKIRKGKDICGCESCDASQCGCNNKKT
jgi:hypothetical protein